MTTPRLLTRPSRWGALLLAVLAYVPSLTAKAGRMPTDTKLFLYLNPGRLVTDAPFTWDTRQFAGWVPHQTIAYLWPSGPWFWFFDQLGVPDWIAHRLWIGTLLFLAGLGIRWAARHLGLPLAGALVAAVVYQLSPYVLPYVSRTSVMLLPWAAVGWLTGLAIRAATRHRWRDAALFALVVFTVGAVNATALAMVAPAPVLWLLHAAWSRTITWRRAVVTAARLGALSLVVSVWWIAMLLVQGRYGADVLAYSESLRAVSLTSTSVETLRGLGYWLFYVRDPYAFTTTAAADYMQSGVLLVIGFTLLLVCLGGIAFTRWSQRRYAALLVFVGIVLAVGVHPIDDPSPLMSPIANSGLSLALRSSTRALPLSTFGLALGAGALVTALATTRFRWMSLAPIAVVALAVLNLPALWTGGFVDEALVRDQDPPRAWLDASADLSASSSEFRVMQLPGAEFGAFRWGYTVDPPLPGLTTKPVVTRDLLPLGSAGAMDLLYALDDRFQEGTIDPEAIAPVARLLGVDTIWVANDMAFDRFRTPRPEWMSALYARVPAGLGTPRPYGPLAPNVPDIAVVDETALSDPTVGAPVPPVELVPVEDPAAIVRASSATVIVAGSGDGIVDAAAAGLITGDEALIYAADATDDDLARAALVIVTDSNRDRAHHWRSSQDVVGFTETGGPGSDLLVDDSADERLPVFTTDDVANQTVAVLDGGLTVRASGYGEPFAYRPEQRPAMAVDGDTATAWVVADRADPVGEFIQVSGADRPLTVLQPQDSAATRMITAVRLERPDGTATPVDVILDDRSLTVPGQQLPDLAGSGPLRVTITGVGPRAGGTDTGPSAVGFAELGLGAHTEVVRPPTDVLSAVNDATSLAIVFTRLRTDPLDRWRSDPEPTMVREFRLPVARTFQSAVTLRLDRRVDDATLNQLAGVEGATSNRRLMGDPDAAAVYATDGSLETAWTSPFVDPVGSQLTIPLSAGVPLGSMTLHQRVDDEHSIITEVEVAVDDGPAARLTVPAPDASGSSRIDVPETTGGTLVLTVTAIDPRTTIDRRFAETTQLPVSITEISSPAVAPPAPVDRAAQSCNDELLTLDGQPLDLAVDDAAISALLRGDTVKVPLCGDEPLVLAAGTHRLVSTSGRQTGIDVDRVVLASPSDGSTSQPDPVEVTVQRTRTTRTATVAPCPDGCWLILGEGYNQGWTASTSAGSLGPPRQIAGGFNGWWIQPSTEPTVVTMTWLPQRRVSLAIGFSVLAVAGCALLAWRGRRGGPKAAFSPPRWSADVLAPVSRRQAAVVALTIVLLAALVIDPPAALVAGLLAIAVILTRRPVLAGIAAVLVAAEIGARVTRRQILSRIPADAAWPGVFENLHRSGLLVVVLILATAMIGDPSSPEEVDIPSAGDHEP